MSQTTSGSASVRLAALERSRPCAQSLAGAEQRVRRCPQTLRRICLQNVARTALNLSAGTVLLLGGMTSAPCAAAPAEGSAAAAGLFEKNCAGCHAGGGNIVQRSATLKQEDLERNGAASSEQIYSLIYSGKGKMPGYGTDCAPKGKCTFAARLSDAQVDDLTQYVLAQAAAGWAK